MAGWLDGWMDVKNKIGHADGGAKTTTVNNGNGQTERIPETTQLDGGSKPE